METSDTPDGAEGKTDGMTTQSDFIDWLLERASWWTM
jgi:hypothetical protein